MGLFARWNTSPPSVVWTARGFNAVASGGSSTFTGVAIGTASATRAVLVATYNSVATGVTVGGISATLVVASSGAGTFALRLWLASVPTGTTATIVVTNSSGPIGELIQVMAAYDLVSTAPYATAFLAGTANHTSDPCNVGTPDNGIAVGFATATTAGVTSATWSGLTLSDSFLETGRGTVFTSALANATVLETPRSISVIWNASALPQIVTASFA